MEDQSQVSSEGQEVTSESPQSAANTTAPAVDSTTKSGDVALKTGSADGATPPPPVYSPNFKFSTYGKEYEVPEQYRQLIKDQQTEKEVKELFEKAYGLDGMKPKYQKLQERAQNYEKTLQEEYTPLRGHFDQLNKYIKNDDYDTLFEVAGISEQKLQAWMLRKLQTAELPPDQKMIYDKEAETRKRAYQLETENQSFKSELDAIRETQNEFLAKQRSQELDTALNQPEVQSLSESYAAKTGKSLRDVVIKFAQAEHAVTGKDMSVTEAVQAVLGLVGVGINPSQASPQIAQTAQTNGAGQKPPVIPNLVGKSTSPTVRKITSIADLEQLARAGGR